MNQANHVGFSPQEGLSYPVGVVVLRHMFGALRMGMEVVMGYDAYNGTFLWKRKILGAVRVRVDVDGSNITATDDAIFVATYGHVQQLDAQTGKTIREFSVPRKDGGKALRWGYLAVHGNILIGTGSVIG